MGESGKSGRHAFSDVGEDTDGRIPATAKGIPRIAATRAEFAKAGLSPGKMELPAETWNRDSSRQTMILRILSIAMHFRVSLI